MHLVHKIARPRGMLFAGSRTEHHITLDVASGLVMLAMADLPAEVRDQQGRVAEPADCIIQPLAWRERLMPTFMGQYPKSGAEETLNECIGGPETSSQRQGWHVFWSAVCVEEVEGRCKQSHISGHIHETCNGRPLEAVLWYGISYLFDGEVW